MHWARADKPPRPTAWMDLSVLNHKKTQYAAFGERQALLTVRLGQNQAPGREDPKAFRIRRISFGDLDWR